ncbi:hypothetical protein ACX8XP_04550 [Calditrichota bacterium LG25]
MVSQKNNGEIEHLENELKKEELLLKIKKLQWEKNTYEIKEDDQQWKALRDQLKAEELNYKIKQLKQRNHTKWILAFVGIIAMLIPIGLLFWKPALFQAAGEINKTMELTLVVNVIWAGVVLAAFKTALILLSLYLIYKILVRLLEEF